MSREWIDRNLGKFASRKLIVFIVATSALYMKLMSGTEWTIIATAYISIEGVTNIVERLKKTN